MVRDIVVYDIRLLRLIAMCHGSERGRRRAEKSAYRVTPIESLQGVSSCCAKTDRRAYHATPDLRWHGQQMPYSSLHVSAEWSTSVDGILPHHNIKLLETTSASLCISTCWLLSWWCPHGTTETRSPAHTHHTSLFQYTINYYPVRGRNLAKTKQLLWISNFIISYWN